MFKDIIASQFKRPSGLLGNFSSRIMEKGNKSNYDVLVKDLDVQPGDKLLEIGYGPGLGSKLIAEQYSSCIIHGIDFSKLMYRRAAKLNKEYIANKRVALFYGDFLENILPETNYDKIFCLNVIYFWDDLQRPFEKLRSLLKSGGIFCFYMAHRDFLIKKKAPDDIFNKYSIEEVADSLNQAGFRKVDYYFDKGYYGKAFLG